MTRKDINNIKVRLLKKCYSTNGCGLLRLVLNTNEIKVANLLVKEKFFDKGISDSKNGTITFFLSDDGRIFLENYPCYTSKV